MKIRLRIVFLCCSFAIGCNSVFYQGDASRWWPPESRGYSCDHRALRMRDGIELDTLFCPAKKTGGDRGESIVVQFHGNAQNINAHYLQLIWLTDEGFDFATFDYRGYGNSGGESDRTGIRADARAYVRHIRETYPKHRRVFYGQSLGGAVLMTALIDEGLRQDEVYVFEGTFSSYQRMGRQFLADRWLFWPFQWLAYILVTDSAAPENDLGQFNNFPVLLIHGEKDPVIPVKHGEIIAEKMGKPLWVIPGGRHLGLWRKKTGNYGKELVEKISALQKTS